MVRTIPAVMFVEMAIDMLKDEDPIDIGKELTEFRELGAARLAAVKQAFIAANEGKTGTSDVTDVEMGYLLGLETARALLETMPAAAQAGVSL